MHCMYVVCCVPGSTSTHGQYAHKSPLLFYFYIYIYFYAILLCFC